MVPDRVGFVAQTSVNAEDADDDNFLLEISPFRVILPEEGRKHQGSFILHNSKSNRFPVCFKIKTTNPEALRIRPRIGCIDVNDKVTVTVSRAQGYPLSERENFLVMATPGPGYALTYEQMQTLWTSVSKENITKRKLSCTFSLVTKAARNKQQHVPTSLPSSLPLAPVPIADDSSEDNEANTSVWPFILMILPVLYALFFFLIYHCASGDIGIEKEAK